MAIRMNSSWLMIGALALVAAPLSAQKIQNTPATDSSAQASPLQKTPAAPAVDAASDASPEVGSAPKNMGSLAPDTAVHVVLSAGIDSGSLKNGQNLHAKLSAAVRTSAGKTLPVGAPVTLTVIGSVPAGRLTAVGEFSLQAVRVGGIETLTDIKTYRGEPGKREVADAAPALGTNAGLPAGSALVFRVSKPAVAANGAPKDSGRTPGSVDGTAPGSKPTANAAGNSGQPTYGSSLPTPSGSQPGPGSETQR